MYVLYFLALLPTIVIYTAIAVVGFFFLRSLRSPLSLRALGWLAALLIVSSPLWLFWPRAYYRAQAELDQWRAQIFFPPQPIPISELIIAGDRVAACHDPCMELLLNRRVSRITLWSQTQQRDPPRVQTVTANITDECRALVAGNAFHKVSGRQHMAQACFSYAPAEGVPDGYVLFVDTAMGFDPMPRRYLPKKSSHLFRYQAFKKTGEKLDEIAYSARIRTYLPAVPPVLLPDGEWANGRDFDFGEEQGRLKLISRIFAVDLTGDVKL
jgi:hypothetical protein